MPPANRLRFLPAKRPKGIDVGIGKLARYLFRKPTTAPTGSKRGPRVHIGCGEIDLPGWINVDGRDFSHVHVVSNRLDLDEFSAESLTEIYLCHVLEHFGFEEVERLLAVFHSKLQPGGVLRLSVPDFSLLTHIYNETGRDLEHIKYALMGGQGYEYNFHKSVFDDAHLRKLLTKAGYSNCENWETVADFGCNIGDWSAKKIRVGARFFPVSLNLKATK